MIVFPRDWYGYGQVVSRSLKQNDRAQIKDKNGSVTELTFIEREKSIPLSELKSFSFKHEPKISEEALKYML